jgi:dihydropteroate synthase
VERPFRVMGVLNVTPDSFSDGGRFLRPAAAIARGAELAGEGADIVDVGGESTRPGAAPVAAAEELRRVLPVVEGLAELDLDVQISIDTSKAPVAAAAIAAGASLVNDVTALRGDPEMAAVVAESGCGCALMHMLGEPRTMQLEPSYEDVVGEVAAFLAERVEIAVAAGIDRERLIVDPGIGFGKTVEHNLALLAGLGAIAAVGRPVLVGTSRKSFLGRIAAAATGREEPPDAGERLAGTIATNVLALERGASIFRVHDVRPVAEALGVAAASLGWRWQGSAAARTRTN